LHTYHKHAHTHTHTHTFLPASVNTRKKYSFIANIALNILWIPYRYNQRSLYNVPSEHSIYHKRSC